MLLGLDIFQSNGMDIDFEKLNSYGFSDKQRQNALKLAEKKRSLKSLRDQFVKNQSRSQVADPSSSHEASNLSRRIDALESEVSELVQSMSESIGGQSSKPAFDSSVFEHDAFNDDEVTDGSEYKRSRISVDVKPSNPNIPSLDDYENLESVTLKLKKLYAMRSSHQDQLSQSESEKKLNEIAKDDDEIDPLDAFMASTTVDLAGENISKIQTELDEIESFITRFESLQTSLSRNLSTTANLKSAIQQQQKIIVSVQEQQRKNPTTAEPVEKPRGTGTVWEAVFQRDEQAQERKKLVQPVKQTTNPHVLSKPINLVSSRAGLHFPGQSTDRSERPEAVPSWRPPDNDDDNQEQLRRKLGY